MVKIGTYSGKLIDPTHLEIADVRLQDIAFSLGGQLRYNGHTRIPYTVAEHSVLVSLAVDQADPLLCMAALMHDAAEAYVGDMVGPLKRTMRAFSELEALVQMRIGESLGFDPFYRRKEVDAMDQALLRKEIELLTAYPPQSVDGLPKVAGLPAIQGLPREMAICAFLERYHLLAPQVEQTLETRSQQRELNL